MPPPAKKLPSRVPPPPCTTSEEPFFAALTELPNSPLDNGRNDIAELQVEQALEGKHTIKMGDHHSEQMDDLNSGPATAQRPGQCDHDCATRGCKNRCVLEGCHDHGNAEPRQCLKCLPGEEETMADLRHAEAVAMDDHDSEQMRDLKSAVLKRCFTPRTRQLRAERRRREAKERQRQRVIRGLVCEARQFFHELMDLIAA